MIDPRGGHHRYRHCSCLEFVVVVGVVVVVPVVVVDGRNLAHVVVVEPIVVVAVVEEAYGQ